MKRARKTKIVCTLGPASESKVALTQMVKSGMNVARLNFSHGSYQHHAMLIKRIREVSKRFDIPVAIMQDLQGPKIRVGIVPKKGVEVFKNEIIILGPESKVKFNYQEDKKVIPLQYENLWQDVKRGDKIMLDDALIGLCVKRIRQELIYAKVLNGGIIFSHKGINAPGAYITAPVITKKDKEDLKFGLQQKVDFVALSFVKSAQDINNLKKLIKERCPRTKDFLLPRIIAKIERQEALKNMDQIMEATDGIMVARGDLGVEVPPQDVPLIQKNLIELCLRKAKPVIVATQMLNSMIMNPRPTRAEVSDVANAVVDHADGVMLSGETAFGKYPVESVKMMNKIVNETERSHYDDLPHGYLTDVKSSVDASVSHAAHELAKNTQAKAILVATSSGYTARMISRHRPEESVILAIANYEQTYRQLALSWGVEPFISISCRNIDQLIDASINFITDRKLVKKGQKVIIVTGQPVGRPGKMNLIRVHVV